MKNRSTGRLGRLFFKAVTLEGRSPGSVVINKESGRDPGTLRAAKHSSMTSFYNGPRPSICFGGFTLIELLVVVLIIGILSAVALPQYQKAVAKARFATVKATARALAEAESVYYMANGEFTSDLQSLAIQMPAGGVLGSDRMFYSWGDCYVACQTESCGGCRLHEEIIYFFPDFKTRRPECVVYDSAASYYKEICLAETGKKENQGIHERTYTRYAY